MAEVEWWRRALLLRHGAHVMRLLAFCCCVLSIVVGDEVPPVINCPDPPPPTHGGRAPAPAADPSHEPGTEVYFYCDDGHSLELPSQGCAVCGPAGSWQPPLHVEPRRCLENATAVRFIPTRRNSKCNLATGVATRTDFEARFPYARIQMEEFPHGPPWFR